MIRVPALIAWEFFSEIGFSGLALDLLCGLTLAILFMALVPLAGRFTGAVMDCVLRGMSELAGHGASFFLANYATFPGVIFHELSHAAGAKLSGARVDRISLFEPNGKTLGCVEFTCRGKKKRHAAFQKAVASCAPVIGGAILVPMFLRIARWGAGLPLLQVMSVHGAFSMACHMDMSRQDMKNYIKGCAWLLPYATMALTVLAYYYGHRIP